MFEVMGERINTSIVDPLDKKIMDTIHTADMLPGRDQLCMEYLKGIRSGTICS